MWDAKFNVLWGRCGAYSMSPPLPDDWAEPKKWIYVTMKVTGTGYIVLSSVYVYCGLYYGWFCSGF